MSWRRHFRELARETAPTPEQQARLRHRVLAPGELLRSTRREARPGAILRLKNRVLAHPPRPGARSSAWWLAPMLTGVSGALVSLILVFGWTRPAIDGSQNVPISSMISSDTDLNAPLLATSWTERGVSAAVTLGYSGAGRLSGTASAPRVFWEVGTLEIAVIPQQGVDLVVETDDGTASVVGTQLSVLRDAFGTAVQVSEGRVRVRCRAGGESVLEAGQQRVCLPVRAAGLLARARALRDVGAPAGEVRAAVDAGIAAAEAGDPALGELLIVQLELLLDAGQNSAALKVARRYLAEGGPRSAEVAEVVRGLEAEKGEGRGP